MSKTKIKINMIGGGFQHTECSSINNIPEYIEWDKNGNASISIHIDNAIKWPVNKQKKNYAWVAESSACLLPLISWVSDNISYLEDNFELIFTHDKRLLTLSNKFKLVICNTTPWVTDCKIHKKTKLISMIASTKIDCEGHRYRQLIVEKYKNKMDCFGRGRNPIDKKEEGLNDYYFSVAILNSSYPNYFTDIVTDCFVTGTIPIYWGTSSIEEFFNSAGIILLTDDFKIEDLSSDLYFSKMDYVLENFERALDIPTAEDYIYKNFILLDLDNSKK